MSDETTSAADAVPAAVPLDQAPAAAPAVDPAFAAAIAAAVAAALRPDPGPAPVTPTTLPAAAPSSASSSTAAAVDPADQVPYAQLFKPGSLAVHTYDHFGRETHQVLLVLGTYQVDVLDKRGNPTGAVQDRVRFLPVGTANDAGDLPADAPELLPASEFDWEEPA